MWRPLLQRVPKMAPLRTDATRPVGVSPPGPDPVQLRMAGETCWRAAPREATFRGRPPPGRIRYRTRRRYSMLTEAVQSLELSSGEVGSAPESTRFRKLRSPRTL